MIRLGVAPVNQWSKQAYSAARKAGFNGTIVISDGFLPPADFVGQFPQSDYPGLDAFLAQILTSEWQSTCTTMYLTGLG